MKKIVPIFMVVLLAVLVSGCANVYYSPDAYDIARGHKTVAILPAVVSIKANRKVSAEAMLEQQRTESLNFQQEIFNWFLNRKMRGQMSQEIQDIATTNAKLAQVNYPTVPKTAEELCQILGVDGVVSSNFALSKPMSDGAAVAMYLLFNAYGSTNEVTVTLSINDCTNHKLIWNYNHVYSGGLGSSPQSLVSGLMRNASRKMPYTIR
jgi:hypothetical protein